MAAADSNNQPKILILATLSGGYAGADAVGQVRGIYPANTYVLPIVSGAMFPEDFYLRSFERGIDAIIVMYSGTDCPFRGAPQRTGAITNGVYARMKERGLDPRRLRLTAVCTVCTKAFLQEVRSMHEVLQEIGPIDRAREVTSHG
jgi:F420-non-reducing hydrogenase iron-sulfur subunit